MNWGRDDDAPHISVNVSGRQLTKGTFTREVRASLDESGLPPHRLVIEMSERSMIDPSGHLLPTVEQLADLGITLAVDHFGAGAGSLAILQWESIRKLKLDRSLLTDIGHSQRSNRIVTAILTLARRLGLETVVEGVETIAQLRAMRFLGCARMQGFLLGDPVAGDQLARQIEDDPKAPWRELLARPEVKSTLGSLTAED
jgi:EAL domain-containing protein (putative c-di-GMP-specific phosphodiesterase class I)